ncbi:MAG: sensor histidine kinase [Candidatus Nanohaloarchaea archaeon]
MFENLITNSIEHNDGEVNIPVGTLENGFYYEDDGRRIPDEIKDDIFEYGFLRSRNGNGLGLSIVKRIVDINGWDIQVMDSEEGGARFEIRFEE